MKKYFSPRKYNPVASSNSYYFPFCQVFRHSCTAIAEVGTQIKKLFPARGISKQFLNLIYLSYRHSFKSVIHKKSE
jgi:hypothetical protein